MQLEVGAIVEGKVTGITKFSAFVELPGGKTGMVHISFQFAFFDLIESAVESVRQIF